jgi:lipopolysaccharide transport system ATP-binding protein
MRFNELAIRVENISKRYRIGLKENIHDSIGGAILDLITKPISNYRKYRSLYRFDDSIPDQNQNSDTHLPDVIWALKEVSFEVKKGEVIGIIGRNGAGKSTLLKILCKITDPTGGRAEIRGRVSSLLEVGTGFHQELTGRENVYLNGTILGMKKSEVDRKFNEIVEFSGVDKFIDTPVKRYSSGMKVRLAFSVAAHLEPEVLLVDEVLAVGDADFQKKCLNKMEDVGQKGRTILFVSHNMAAITRLCSRAILLDDGRLIQDGPSSQVVSSYLTSGSGSTASSEWHEPEKAPSGPVARLRAVRVRAKDGQIAESVNIDAPFTIEMEYEVLKSGYILMSHYHLYNEEGIEVFGVHDTDPEWMDRPRATGLYRSTTTIPGNLLSEGMLFVNVGLSSLEPHNKQFYERAAVAFQVIENSGERMARGRWAGQMTGVIRPLLEWKTEYEP